MGKDDTWKSWGDSLGGGVLECNSWLHSVLSDFGCEGIGSQTAGSSWAPWALIGWPLVSADQCYQSSRSLSTGAV